MTRKLDFFQDFHILVTVISFDDLHNRVHHATEGVEMITILNIPKLVSLHFQFITLSLTAVCIKHNCSWS